MAEDREPQRRLILYMSMSLDGFGARRDGTMDWLGEAQRFGSHRQRGVAELLGQIGLIVLGSGGGRQMAQAWPGSTSPTGRLANSTPKVVFSRSITEVDWEGARVSARPVEEEIPELKREPGKDIVVFGGVSFARSLAGLGLIDEYRINVHPVALGDGLPLLHGIPHPQPLELVASTAWADGRLSHTYRPRTKETS